MKKRLAAIACLMGLSVLGVNTQAQTPTQVQAQAQGQEAYNRYQERKEVLNAFTLKETIGWYTSGRFDYEVNNLVFNYLPLSNYLSKVLSEVVILEPIDNDEEIVKEALNGAFDIVYVPAPTGIKLLENGWIPVVGRNITIKAVVIAKKDLKKPLQDITVYSNSNAIISRLLSYSIEDKKSNLKHKTVDYPQDMLLKMLQEGTVDAVAVRDGFAEDFLKQRNGEYQAIFDSVQIPGHMVFAKNTPQLRSKIENLKVSLLNLNTNTPNAKNIIRGLEGTLENVPFKEVNQNDLAVASKISSKIKKTD